MLITLIDFGKQSIKICLLIVFHNKYVEIGKKVGILTLCSVLLAFFFLSCLPLECMVFTLFEKREKPVQVIEKVVLCFQ